MPLNWNVSLAEAILIDLIVGRAASQDLIHDKSKLNMDITAVHANGCPLDLEQLFHFETMDFAHDVCGIFSNINRRTGKLENYFLPRCAARTSEGGQ